MVADATPDTRLDASNRPPSTVAGREYLESVSATRVHCPRLSLPAGGGGTEWTETSRADCGSAALERLRSLPRLRRRSSAALPPTPPAFPIDPLGDYLRPFLGAGGSGTDRRSNRTEDRTGE